MISNFKVYRDFLINQLPKYIGETVKIAGWVCNKRDHGNILFMELRDSSGVVQIVCGDLEQSIPLESVVSIEGVVVQRSQETINPHAELGYLEITLKSLEIISICSHLPFSPLIANTVNEELQQKYRYITLRNEKCLQGVLMKSKLIKFCRDFMNSKEFLEIHTPILTASSPEGARDFVIPSRLHPGKFYALPQAPQIYKQLLMVSGIDKYFQVAPCFRDEDSRKDRNYGEFHQLDFEISFSNQETVLAILQEFMNRALEEFSSLPTEFTRLTYKESMETYGTDKPNLNNPLVLEDFTDIFENSGMDLFVKKIRNSNHLVKGVRTKSYNENPDHLLKAIWDQRKFRVAYIKKEGGELKGPIAKFIDNSIINEGETIFFVCDEYEKACNNAGIIIKHFEPSFNQKNHVVFVTDFPMFEKNDDGSYTFKHNPFSMPQSQSLNEDLETINAYQYDMVLNGYELASGSMRNHDINLLEKCLGLCGISTENHVLLRAFKSGVPPHSGAAIGIDRLAMILINGSNTREVNAFPMNTNGFDYLMNSPCYLNQQALLELHIATVKPRI